MPLGAVDDQGSSTTILMPGNAPITGKLFGPMQFRKFDGTAAHAEYVHSPSDNQSVLVLRESGQAMGAIAWRGINIATNTSMDIERIEAGATLYEKVTATGSRYMLARPYTGTPGTELAASQFGVFLNEGANTLVFVVKYAGGTVKTGTVALS
jgi:hypothetical protein